MFLKHCALTEWRLCMGYFSSKNAPPWMPSIRNLLLEVFRLADHGTTASRGACASPTPNYGDPKASGCVLFTS